MRFLVDMKVYETIDFDEILSRLPEHIKNEAIVWDQKDAYGRADVKNVVRPGYYSSVFVGTQDNLDDLLCWFLDNTSSIKIIGVHKLE